jgi:glycosyltransferase involved in cell wall biosynthesis
MTDWKAKLQQLGIVVIIPTYNNEKTLASVINGVKEYSSQIIVVNDGSTDSTAEILLGIDGIQVLTHKKNKGKGYALKNSLREAKEQGFRYAITIDSDGQHYPSDIPVFIKEIEKTPDSLLVGARNLQADNMPGKNTFANKFSNFWFKLETGIKLEDTQSGYRLYPLYYIGNMKIFTAKYEFELEAIVFSAWKGVNVKNIPIHVYYPPEGERVSHFRPLRDFTRISILNTVLVLIALLWVYPVKFFKQLNWRNIKAFFNKQIFQSEDSNHKIVFSVMLGIFMGIVPLWGYQMLAAFFLAQFLKLNKVITLVMSNISIPPMIPFILYGSYATGCIITGSPISLSIGEMSLEAVEMFLFHYLIGSIVFATLCSIAIGFIFFILLLIFRKKKNILNTNDTKNINLRK